MTQANHEQLSDLLYRKDYIAAQLTEMKAKRDTINIRIEDLNKRAAMIDQAIDFAVEVSNPQPDSIGGWRTPKVSSRHMIFGYLGGYPIEVNLTKCFNINQRVEAIGLASPGTIRAAEVAEFMLANKLSRASRLNIRAKVGLILKESPNFVRLTRGVYIHVDNQEANAEIS